MLQTVVGATATNYYLFHDQLGSLVRIAGATGTVVSSMDFQAFGGRRNTDTQAANGTPPALTPRGFTGHEMLDSVSLIHMNGRIFDPYGGRFLQPDPVIQAPDNAQSWNAYTYAINNPLKYVDPTGYFWAALLGAAVDLTAVTVLGTAGITAAQVVAMAAAATTAYVAAAQAGASGAQGVNGAYGSGDATTLRTVQVRGVTVLQPHQAEFLAGDFAVMLGSVQYYGGGEEFVYLSTSGDRMLYQELYTTNGPQGNTYQIGSANRVPPGGPETWTDAQWRQAMGRDAFAIARFFYAPVDMAANMWEGNWGTAGVSAATSIPVLRPLGVGSKVVAKGVAPTVEQYALRAADSGFYPVMTRGSKAATEITWLEKGDVWKFGTTKNPGTRYSQSYLDSIGDYGVLYRTEWQGTAAEALQLERMKIMNFQSQTGGVLPAGNKIVR